MATIKYQASETFYYKLKKKILNYKKISRKKHSPKSSTMKPILQIIKPKP